MAETIHFIQGGALLCKPSERYFFNIHEGTKVVSEVTCNGCKQEMQKWKK